MGPTSGPKLRRSQQVQLSRGSGDAQGTRRIDHHRRLQSVPREQIANGSARHAKESTSCHSVDESANEHRLDVHCCGAWNGPDNEKYERNDIYRSTTIELLSLVVANDISRVW